MRSLNNNCEDYFCNNHVVETKCCGAILCNKCVIPCNSEKYNGYYCEDCLIDEYHHDTNQVGYQIEIVYEN